MRNLFGFIFQIIFGNIFGLHLVTGRHWKVFSRGTTTWTDLGLYFGLPGWVWEIDCRGRERTGSLCRSPLSLLVTQPRMFPRCGSNTYSLATGNHNFLGHLSCLTQPKTASVLCFIRTLLTQSLLLGRGGGLQFTANLYFQEYSLEMPLLPPQKYHPGTGIY